MLDRIQQLKTAVLELEQAVLQNDGTGYNQKLHMIREICNDLKVATQERTAPVKQEVPYRTINTIPFLMKPVIRGNLFEGTYLEQFSEERTEQLMQSRAINNHNEFWKQHETIRGNVYGAVPEELISPEASESLMGRGWERVEVDILDFGTHKVAQKGIADFCERNFDYYILVKETSTDTVLALVFNI